MKFLLKNLEVGKMTKNLKNYVIFIIKNQNENEKIIEHEF